MEDIKNPFQKGDQVFTTTRIDYGCGNHIEKNTVGVVQDVGKYSKSLCYVQFPGVTLPWCIEAKNLRKCKI